MHPLLRKTGIPALAAVAGGVLAGVLLPGVPVTGSAFAAAAAGMAVLALEAARPGEGRERRSLVPLVPGLLAASLSLGLPAGSVSTGLVAFTALVAAVLLIAGTARIAARLVEAEDEAEELRARLLRREADVRVQAERIRRLDLRDPATGALNARAFDEALADALAGRGSGPSEPASLLLVELPDRDHVPLAVEAALRAVRASDLVARLDEREIAILLGGCRDPRPALVRMRRILGTMDRDMLARTRIAGITVPGGVEPPRPDQLLQAAWAALDAARRLDDAHGAQAVWPLEWGLAQVAER